MASGSINPILKEVVFSDVNVSFTPHPVTGRLPVLRNAEAVKKSVRNLILTNHGERRYEPLYGGNIRALLFENTDDPLLDHVVKTRIEAAIANFEPRARVDDIIVDLKPDANALVVKVRFTIVNERFPVELEIVIERAR